MAIYNRGESSSLRVEIKGVDVMHYIQLVPGEVYDGVAGEGSGPCAGVDITPDDTGRRDAIQLVEDLHLAQVAGVDDVVNVLDCVGYLGAKQPVGIGKNRYRDHGSTDLWSGRSTARGSRGMIASFWCNVNKYFKNNLPFRGEAEDVAGAVALGIISDTQVGTFGSVTLTFLNRGTFQAVSRQVLW